MRAFEAARAQPWLITEDWLRQILDIAAREHTVTPEAVDKIDARREALAARKSRQLDSTRYTTKRENGVAVIDISGPIVRYADLFSEISGGTATAHLALDFQTAIEDSSVRAIVLNIDSPGGEATGIHELGEMIYAARGKKPVAAYAEGYAASAAYWLASAADEIVTDKTAMLGSIGVVFAVPDPTKRTAKDIEIVSSQSPKKRLDPTTEAGRSELQRWADELGDVFVSSVARNRAVSEEVVLSEFGQGGIRIGADAVAHRMADRLGSLESLISELGRPRVAAVQNKPTNRGASMSEKKAAPAAEETNTHPPADENPKIVAMQKRIDELTAITQASEERAAKAERDRLTTEANAKVDGWEREGSLSGNATAAVRDVYVAAVTGQTITAEQVEKMVAALPKIGGDRLAKTAKADEGDKPTKADFTAAERKGDVTAKAKIDAYVKKQLAADKTKTYSAHWKAVRAEAFASTN